MLEQPRASFWFCSERLYGRALGKGLFWSLNRHCPKAPSKTENLWPP
jgi:hypothetical protein